MKKCSSEKWRGHANFFQGVGMASKPFQFLWGSNGEWNPILRSILAYYLITIQKLCNYETTRGLGPFSRRDISDFRNNPLAVVSWFFE